MLADSQFAVRLEEKKRKQEEMQEEYNKALGQAKIDGEELEALHKAVPILNQELQILKFEFQIEETQLGAPQKLTEKVDTKKNFYCKSCCCPTNQQQIVEEDASSQGLKYYLHVKNLEDFQCKSKNIKKRYDQLYFYGLNSCNAFTDACQQCPACAFGYTCIPFCPCYCMSYLCYHCYSGVGTYCYRKDTRTQKIWNIYQNIKKYENTKETNSVNMLRIQKLKNTLKEKQTIREQAFMGNTNQIQLLNIDLQTMRLKYSAEDMKTKKHSQTLAKQRKAVCCCTYSLDKQFKEVPCDVKSFQDYFKVKDHKDYDSKIKQLKQMDKDLACFDCVFCAACTEFFMGQQKQQFEKVYYPDDKQNNCFVCWCQLVPFQTVVMPFILPLLCTYCCCEWCCDGCYRRGSRIHNIYETYDSYSNIIVTRET